MRRATALAAIMLLVACAEEAQQRPLYEAAAVSRDTIEVGVSSAGIVEPLSTVEVKSKASGEVLGLSVGIGDFAEQDALLVTIDPRAARNRLAQAEAALKAAEARREISRTQTNRARSLVETGTLTQTDYEQAALELANAESLVVSSRVEVENARIAVDDTAIRAPVSGVVIEKTVETGQVISSPTQDVGGGTLLLKMADLSRMQIRALVDETDVGKVKPGMPASVVVAAYPNQPFTGEVVKVEPQAVLDQNVTMFAVLVSIENPQGLLMPGMNAEVDISIARSAEVLTVPVMALRTERDLAATAGLIGIAEDDLRAQLANGGRMSAADGRGGETIVLRDRRVTLPQGVAAAEVRALLQKRQAGETLDADEQAVLQRVMRAAAEARPQPQTDYRFGGDFWVVVDASDGPQPVNVRAGLTDLERVEIVSGLDESDRVLLLPSAHLLETQEALQNFINRRVGGVPGIGAR